jgi:hypothetical protein
MPRCCDTRVVASRRLSARMKRIPTFLLLGPFLSWLTCIAIAFSITPNGQPIFEDDRYWPASFMVCCTFALLPLWATAHIDRKLSRYRLRSVACFAVGFGLATALHYTITHEGGVERTCKSITITGSLSVSCGDCQLWSVPGCGSRNGAVGFSSRFEKMPGEENSG